MNPLETVLDNIVGKNVIVFDGECVLCSRFFQFIVSIDRDEQFHFMTAQSSSGVILYDHFGLKQDDYDTSLVLIDGKLFERLHGFYKVMRVIGFPWSLLSVFGVLPAFVNDFIYNRVVRNRYRLFGRRDSCLIPDQTLKSRFLD